MTKLLRAVRPGQKLLLGLGILLAAGQAGFLLTAVRLHHTALCLAAALLLAVLGAWTSAAAVSEMGKTIRETLFDQLLSLDLLQHRDLEPEGLSRDPAAVEAMAFAGRTVAAVPILILGAGIGLVGAYGTVERLGLLGLLILGVVQLIRISAAVRQAEPAIKRMTALLDRSPQIRYGTRTAGPESGTLEFRHVSFRYPDAEEAILKDLNFKLCRGQSLGIVGSSGSGKTTLLHLAARLYTPTEGQILLDGSDIREYSREALYDRLGYFLQTPMLFSGTVEENVNFGESDAVISREQTWLALSQARANDYVEQLPGGLKEFLKPERVPLTEQKKLQIARILARNPEVMLFDQPGTDLDEQTVRSLRDGLHDDLTGITKIITGQTLAAVRQTDQVLILGQSTE